MDDFQSRKHAEDSKTGILITLHLLPGVSENSDEIIVSADLEVFIALNYPKQAPFKARAKRTRKGTGLLKISQEAELNAQLQAALQRFLPGDEVILQLASVVQDYLTANNKHPESEHAKMMREREQRKLAKQKAKEALPPSKRKDASRARHSLTSRPGVSDEFRSSPEPSDYASSSSDTSPLLHDYYLSVHDLHRPPTPLRSDPGQPSLPRATGVFVAQEPVSLLTAQLAQSAAKLTGSDSPSQRPHAVQAADLSDLSKWERSMAEQIQESDFYLMINRQTSQWVMARDVATKMTAALEQRINSLKPLYFKHIAAYLDVGKKPNTTMIFQEYCGDISISALRWEQCSEEKLQMYTHQILAGLQYLHSQGVVHGNLTPRTTLLDRSWMVKLCDWGYTDVIDPKLRDRPFPQGCVDDVRMLGLLLASLASHKAVPNTRQHIDAYSRPFPVVMPVSDSFFSFVAQCLKGRADRVAVPALLEHPFILGVFSSQPVSEIEHSPPDIDGLVPGSFTASSPHHSHFLQDSPPLRSPGGRMRPRSHSTAHGDTEYLRTAGFGIDTKEHVPFPSSYSPLLSSPPLHPADGMPSLKNTRYFTDFEEICEIGGGAFGMVYRVKNRLDGRSYAIKKIPLAVGSDPRKAQLQKNKVLREVTTLASLQHQYIVRYFQSWIGEDHLTVAPGDLASSSGSDEGSSESSLGLDLEEDEEDTFINIHANRSPYSKPTETKHPVPASSSEKSYRGKLSPIEPHDAIILWSDNDDPDPIWSSSGEDASEESDFIPSPTEKHSALSSSSSSSSEEEAQAEEDEEDEEEDEAQEEAPAKVRFSLDQGDSFSHSTSLSSQSHPVATRTTGYHGDVLYIQMELCSSKTLRSLIDDQTCYNQPEMRWRMFRQILEAMDYIHAQGIIHRDLKPENVFIDDRNDIQIGDFGLAAYGNTPAAPAIDLSTSFASLDQSMKTQGVGTPLYTAPEVTRAERYDEKADMYSVGIILFEMCSPDMTLGSMERVYTIQRLIDFRIFPSDFVEQPPIKPIVQALLNENPQLRPTPLALLSSDFLPRQIDQDTLRSSMRTLTQPGTTMYRDLMETLFAKAVLDDQRGFAYDFADHQRISFSDLERNVSDIVSNTLVNIMQRHGATKLCPSFVLPSTQFISQLENITSQTTASMISKNGTLVMLPYDLSLPFARFLLHLQPKAPFYLKRYQVGPVFRAAHSEIARPPTEFQECVYDVVTVNSGQSPALRISALGEVIKVLIEIMTSFQPYIGANWVLRINHWGLFDEILNLCRVPQSIELRSRFCCELERSWRMRWSNVARTLREFLPATVVDDLSNFFKVSGAITMTIRDKLNPLLRSESPEDRSIIASIKKYLDELLLLDQVLQSFGISCQRFRLDLRMIYNRAYYDGSFIFQAVTEQENRLDIIAAGGCYDHLLSRLSHSGGLTLNLSLGSSKPGMPRMSAHGLNLSVKKLADYTRHYVVHDLGHCVGAGKKSNPLAPALRTIFAPLDILVVNLGSSPSLETWSILSELWGFHLRADTYHGEHSSIDEIVRHAKTRGIPWLLILVKKTFLASRTLSLRAVFDKSADIEIPRSSLSDQIKAVVLPSLLQHSFRVRTLEPFPKDIVFPTHTASVPSEAARSSSLAAPPAVHQPISAVISKTVEKSASTGGLILTTIPAANERNQKKLKALISSKLSNIIGFFNGPLYVIAVDVPFPVIRQITAQPFRPSVSALDNVIQEHFRYKATLELLQSHLNANLNSKARLYLLWSIQSEKFDCLFPYSPALGRR